MFTLTKWSSNRTRALPVVSFTASSDTPPRITVVSHYHVIDASVRVRHAVQGAGCCFSRHCRGLHRYVPHFNNIIMLICSLVFIKLIFVCPKIRVLSGIWFKRVYLPIECIYLFIFNYFTQPVYYLKGIFVG